MFIPVGDLGGFSDSLQELQIFASVVLIQPHAGQSDLIGCSLLGGLSQKCLVLRREGIPHLGIDNEQGGVGNVVPVGHELMILVNFHGIEGVDGILLSVDNALLNRGHGIAPDHGHRVGAKSLEGIQKQGAADDTDLQAVQILGGCDGALAVGQLAESVFTEADELSSFGLDGFGYHLARLSVCDGVQCLVTIMLRREEKRQCKEVELGNLRRIIDGGLAGEVDGPIAKQHEGIGLFSGRQLRVGINLDVDFPLAAFSDQIGEVLSPHAPACGDAGDNVQLIFGLVGCGGWSGKEGTEKNERC